MLVASDIVLLKQHLQQLSDEIQELKKQVSPNMTPKEYRAVHEKYVVLNNLKAIAKNEIDALLHLYKIVLAGTADKIGSEKIFRAKIRSEIDCRLNVSKNLDLSIRSHSELYAHLVKNYSRLFFDGKFRVRSVIQLR